MATKKSEPQETPAEETPDLTEAVTEAEASAAEWRNRIADRWRKERQG